MVASLSLEKLKKSMESQGVKTLNDLAKLSGVHRNTLYPYIRGEKPVYAPPIVQIARALKVDPLTLCDREELSVDQEIVRISNSLVASFGCKYDSLVVVLFGSRARGQAKKFSDFDLGVSSGLNPVSFKDFLSMKDHVENLADDLIYKVDLVNLDNAPDWFLANLLQTDSSGNHTGLVFLSGSKDTYHFLRGRAYGAIKADLTSAPTGE